MGETERRREQPQVAVIPATRRAVRAGGQITGAGRLRVAAYCRVSTGDESQQTSYVRWPGFMRMRRSRVLPEPGGSSLIR